MIKEAFMGQVDTDHPLQSPELQALLFPFIEPDFSSDRWEETAECEIQHYLACDVIAVLGASAYYNPTSDTWKSTDKLYTQSGSIVGERVRATAIAELCALGYTGPVLVTGGVQTDENSGSSISKAQVLADSMVTASRLSGNEHIDPEQIHVIGKEGSGNTLGNIDNIRDWCTTYSDRDIPFTLGILSNGWHIPRAALMCSLDTAFTLNGIDLQYINADLVTAMRSKWHALWLQHYATNPASLKSMGERISSEINGIDALLNGTYESRSY